MKLPIALAAFLIALMLAIQFPTEIYSNNILEFSINFSSMLYVFSIAWLAYFLFFLSPILIPSSTFRERYFAFLATFAFLIWFNAHFLFGNYGAFDGRGLT